MCVKSAGPPRKRLCFTESCKIIYFLLQVASWQNEPNWGAYFARPPERQIPRAQKPWGVLGGIRAAHGRPMGRFKRHSQTQPQVSTATMESGSGCAKDQPPSGSSAGILQRPLDPHEKRCALDSRWGIARASGVRVIALSTAGRDTAP
jgi:hypothetical protein